MSNYILVSEEKEKNIIKVEVKDSYDLVDGHKRHTRIKKAQIYDNKALNKVIKESLLKKYEEIKTMMANMDDDSSPDGWVAIISKIDYLAGLLQYKYEKLLKKEAYELFIDKLIKDRKECENRVNKIIEKYENNSFEEEGRKGR